MLHRRIQESLGFGKRNDLVKPALYLRSLHSEIRAVQINVFAAGQLGLKTGAWALDDVSFEVKRGDVVGIIGRYGAGKSSLGALAAYKGKPGATPCLLGDKHWFDQLSPPEIPSVLQPFVKAG